MTTARRQARATHSATIDGLSVPIELLDPDHPVWVDSKRHRKFIEEHRLTSHVAREGITNGDGVVFVFKASPHKRRDHASMSWGLLNDITRTYGSGNNPYPDLHRLRAMGLYGSPDAEDARR